jgi:hypothetical protein
MAAFSNSRRNSVSVARELNNISKTAFLEGMKKLKERANKFIDQGEIYFEGKINYVHLRSYLCFIKVVLKRLGRTLYNVWSRDPSAVFRTEPRQSGTQVTEPHIIWYTTHPICI